MMMKFMAVLSTSDKRITMGVSYVGSLVWKAGPVGQPVGLRIAVYDDRGEWTTFDPAAFCPPPEAYQ